MEFQLAKPVDQTVVEDDESLDDQNVDDLRRLRFGVQMKVPAKRFVHVTTHSRHVQRPNDVIIDVVYVFNPLVVRMIFRVEVVVLAHDLHLPDPHLLTQATHVRWVAEVLVQRTSQRGFSAARHTRYPYGQPHILLHFRQPPFRCTALNECDDASGVIDREYVHHRE